MRREISNPIRKFIDEALPPLLRDSRPFNYPMFWYWFEGKHVDEAMRFKDFAFDLSDREFREFYDRIQCRASRRPTDCNEASLAWVLQRLDQRAASMIDIGCGHAAIGSIGARTSISSGSAMTCTSRDRTDASSECKVTSNSSHLRIAHSTS